MGSEKDFIVAKGVLKTPPMSEDARIEAGFQLRRLQEGEKLSLPISRPMPSIGRGCHELRIDDSKTFWRIIYLLTPNEVIVLDVFKKKSNETPKKVIDACKKRIKQLGG